VAWPLALLLIFGCLLVLMATGMPIFCAFLLTCVMGTFVFWGGTLGMEQLATSIYSSVTSFSLVPIVLFMLMGNIIFESGAGVLIVDAVDKILGRLPGRLGILAIGAGTLLGTMIGVSGGSIAILGKSLVPDMARRGYQKPMTLGPIVASGTLATMIPPSALAVFLGAIAKVSIGKLLIAIIMPGLLLAFLFAAYIISRCVLQPSVAPSYAVAHVPLLKKVTVAARHIVPIGIVIFAVIGVIFMGIATPSEAAALGALACYIIAALYKGFNRQMLKESAKSTVQITVMVLVILTASISFSRILAYSGAVAGLVNLATALPVAPIVIIIATQVVVLIMGCLMDPGSIIMISVPIFVPIVSALGYDPLWYSVLLLINIQLGLITPPFGLDVYTMKALAPPDVSVGDVFRASTPFLIIGFIVMALIMVFPQITLWLPDVAR
jgi:tripartite ATP-independent transporter DctM subunit